MQTSKDFLATARGWSAQERLQEVRNLRKDLMRLRIEKVTKREGVPLHKFSMIRKNIARLMTLRNKEAS